MGPGVDVQPIDSQLAAQGHEQGQRPQVPETQSSAGPRQSPSTPTNRGSWMNLPTQEPGPGQVEHAHRQPGSVHKGTKDSYTKALARPQPTHSPAPSTPVGQETPWPGSSQTHSHSEAEPQTVSSASAHLRGPQWHPTGSEPTKHAWWESEPVCPCESMFMHECSRVNI